MICIRFNMHVVALARAVCPIFFPLSLVLSVTFGLFYAARRVHVALLPLKCCSPSRRRGGHPVTDCSRAVRAWGIGGGESLRKGGRDWRTELRGKPGSHEQAQICLQTECVRPGKTQEPSWITLLVSLTSTLL